MSLQVANNARKPLTFLIAITVVLAFYSRPLQAETFTCAARDVTCLIGSINQANANGRKNTIRLAAGTYSLTFNNDTDGPNGLPSVTSKLTIEGIGADLTILERPPSAPQFRLLHVAPTGDLTLVGVTLTGGRPSAHGTGGRPTHYGGGIFNNGGTVTLIRCTVRKNSPEPGASSNGGGIYNRGGQVTITGTTFSGNVAQYSGGGLFNDGGDVTLTQSTFAENVADSQHGGALSTSGGTVRIDQSRFTGNLAQFLSGGLNIEGGTVFVNSSTFDHNLAEDPGAIRVAQHGTLIVTDSAFIENMGHYIGAIENFGGSIVIINTTFAHNTSRGTSAIENLSGNLALINSTIAENPLRPGPSARALFSGTGATTILQNTILARNSVQDCSGTVTSLGFNLIGDQSGCNIILQPSDLVGDPGLGTLTDNGQPGNAHFLLLPNSQAINGGTSAACPKQDQIGQPRKPRCDIGAIEFKAKGKDHDQE